MNRRIINVLLILIICIGTIPVIADEVQDDGNPPFEMPFIICGWVNDSNGEPVTSNLNVTITNTNTSDKRQAEVYAGYNFYQLVFSITKISAGDPLEFNATNGRQYSTTNHTVTQENIGDDGLFDFNITLEVPAARTGEININEIMYAPTDAWGGEDNEWIELYNNDTKPINVSDWAIDGRAIPEAIIMYPGDYLIITRNDTRFNETYPEIVCRVVEVAIELQDDGETIFLNDSLGNVTDSINYTLSASQGLARNNGKTLELNAATGGWEESLAEGGTPCTLNSVIVGPPNITHHAPNSPVNDAEGESRTFRINISQIVNVSWQINGSEVQRNESVTKASYTNTSASIGIWNVSAIASNERGAAMQTWVWNVGLPRVHNLNTSEVFSTIQDAIYDPDTNDTHIIIVDPGTYNENVNMNRSLTIESNSSNPADTIITGSIGVAANSVSISGFTVHEGISLSGVHNCIVEKNVVSGGISLSSSSNNNITKNNVSHNGNGIYLTPKGKYAGGSNHNTIANNIISNNTGYGIYIGGGEGPAGLRHSSDYNTITNNTVLNNRYGIYIRPGSGGDLLHGNTLINNTVSNNRYGIYLGLTYRWLSVGGPYITRYVKVGVNSVCNSRLINNTVSNNTYGIYLNSSKNTTLRNNTISGNRYNFGVISDVSFSSPSHFNNHTIDTSNLVDGKPIYYLVNEQNQSVPNDAGFVGIVNCTNITVSNLTLAKNYEGVLVACSNHSRIQNFTASDNYYGIYLFSSNNNTLTENTASNNSYGICTRPSPHEDSRDNILTNNSVSNNSYGIYQDWALTEHWKSYYESGHTYWYVDARYEGFSRNSTLISNSVSNNEYGIYLSSSSNNTIYNNHFNNNTNNARDDGNNNVWNITKTPGENIIGGAYLGGNYWSDYAGMDANGDGLGDSFVPYDSGGNITNGGDYLPLTPVNYAVHNLNSGRNFSTIQAAIDDPDTMDGNILTAEPGIYNENVLVNKSLTIRSTSGNSSDTIVRAVNASRDVFTVCANNVTISGFGIENATSAAGIYLENVESCIITNNTATNNEYGIYLNFSKMNTLVNNAMSGNRYNFGVVGISLSEYIQNIDMSNKVDGKPIYYLVNGQDQQIPDGAGFVGLVNCTNITVKDLTLTNNGEGVLVVYTTNSRIENAFVTNNEYGIYIHSSSNNTIYNNYFNNVKNARDDGNNNVWNTTKTNTNGTNIVGGAYLGGNCWSDYAGNDTDEDGLGDTFVPYNASGNITNGGDYLPLMPRVHNLNTGEGFGAIQAAINDPDTKDGHTITVDPGTYKEAVITVNKALTIRSTSGNPADTTVEGRNHPAFIVTADYVTISGFTATRRWFGPGLEETILLSGVKHCIIINNTVLGSTVRGIALFGGGYNEIANNTVYNADLVCIYLYSSSNNRVINNTVETTGSSFYYSGIELVDSSSNNFVANNTATNSGCGIYLASSSSNNNTVTYNEVTDNTYGIGIFMANGNTVTYNEVTDNTYGIRIVTGNGSTVTYNEVTDNTDGIIVSDGLWEPGSSNNTIANNIVSKNENYGIRVASTSVHTECTSPSNYNEIRNNNVTNNKYGIDLGSASGRSSHYNTLTNNSVSNNEYYGIYLDSSKSNNFSGNTISGSKYNFGVVGISLSEYRQDIDTSNLVDGKPIYYLVNEQNRSVPNDAGFVGIVNCRNITVSNLTLAENYEGVLVAYSNHSRIQNFTASDNYYGIYLWGSSGNRIYNNYFNNVKNARDDESNTWNITKALIPEGNIIGGAYLGGNYWSDYEGNDTDGDGLGDTLIPYNSSDNIMNGGDQHPLTETSLNITSYAPSSPVRDTEGATRTFNITTNQVANVSWQIEGRDNQTDKNVTAASYTRDAELGTWIVWVNASNQNGTDNRTWIWYVTNESEPTHPPGYGPGSHGGRGGGDEGGIGEGSGIGEAGAGEAGGLQVPVNTSGSVSEELTKTTKGYPFGNATSGASGGGGTLPLLFIALIALTVALFYFGYYREKRTHTKHFGLYRKSRR